MKKNEPMQNACYDDERTAGHPAAGGVVWASQGDCPQAGSARPVRPGAGRPRRRPGRL